ncbi:MAG TPA: VOC family protein, partial [Stellaceae bacterium]|nr:VOC family protein [Stellaceae bacterium]
PAGTGNRCAMLSRGYVEILGKTSDTPLARQLEERLKRHVGLHLAAFSTADAAAERERLAAAGFAVPPLVDMRRPVATAAGSEDARFTIARIAEGAMPEGRMQFLAHHTPHLVWREGYLDHPNGARALLGAWIAAADPAEAALRFARFTGRQARREHGRMTISLDRGNLFFATPDFLHIEFGIMPGPPNPHLAAYEVGADSLPSAGRPIERGIAVTLPPALGGTILFRAP